MWFPDNSPLGELRFGEIYEYYDGPVLFSCRNAAEQVFLAVSVEDSDTSRRWLYCPVSRRRLAEIERGTIELRSAFTAAETGFVYEVKFDSAGESFDTIATSRLVDSDLPYPGERLQPSAKIEHFQQPVASEHAQQSRRETLRLALSPRGMVGNETPSRLLGQVLVSVQELVSAIGQALAGPTTIRGRLPPDILDATELRAVAVFPGSFGVELAAAHVSDMFDDSPLAASLDQFDRLIEADSDVEALTALLHELQPRVASKYMHFIALLDDAKSGITLDWGSVQRTRGAFHTLAPEVLSRINSALVRTGVSDSVVYEVAGVLIGLNTRTRSFELQSRVDQTRVSGRLDAKRFASDEEFTINAPYVATIEETIEVSGLTGQESVSRLLRDLAEPKGAG